MILHYPSKVIFIQISFCPWNLRFHKNSKLPQRSAKHHIFANFKITKTLPKSYTKIAKMCPPMQGTHICAFCRHEEHYFYNFLYFARYALGAFCDPRSLQPRNMEDAMIFYPSMPIRSLDMYPIRM